MVQAPNPLGKKKAVYTTRLPRRTEKCGIQKMNLGSLHDEELSSVLQVNL